MRSLTGLWALLGVGVLFGSAVVSLGVHGLGVVASGLTPFQWLALVVLGWAFVYGEGMRALQRAWIPSLLHRARGLAAERNPLYHLLAPLYGMSLLGAPARDLRRSWTLAAAIAVAAGIVRRLPEPWRGITDLSVAGALAWGLGCIAWGAVELATEAAGEAPSDAREQDGGASYQDL